MKTITLRRRTPLEFSEKGVQGKLYDDKGKFICYTLERPWRNNRIGESCIPAGTYPVTKRHKSTHGWARFPEAFELHDTAPRSAILIHVANYITELEGCIAVGMAASDLFGVKLAVWRSRAAMKRLRNITPDEFYLEIINA